MIGGDACRTGVTGSEGLGIDLTPLLDIMFLLLVFFILTAHSVEHAFEMDLPVEGAEQARPVESAEKFTISLHVEGPHWGINGRRIAHWDEMREAILVAHEGAPDAPVVIAGDRLVPMERLLKLLAFLKGEGLTAAQILMDTSKATQGAHEG